MAPCNLVVVIDSGSDFEVEMLVNVMADLREM